VASSTEAGLIPDALLEHRAKLLSAWLPRGPGQQEGQGTSSFSLSFCPAPSHSAAQPTSTWHHLGPVEMLALGAGSTCFHPKAGNEETFSSLADP
jgi:hypothetical protein